MAQRQQSRPEPMNASPHHSKVKVTLTPGNPIFIAGSVVTGKMELECRTDKALGISVIMVELFAIQELTSRDHSATSTFLHSRRMFQGPGLPPSNAVQAYPTPGSAMLPPDYHQARRGVSTFLFRFQLPASSPSSIDLGGGLAKLRYELRATVGVAWKGERRLVTDRNEVDVVESFCEEEQAGEVEGVVVGEGGKIWVQGRVIGGVVVAGEIACVELQVKNHSSKKNTSLSVTLTRNLHLPHVPPSEKQPIQIADTLTTVAFKGSEYIIPSGAEGVASLVFDVPLDARGVRGGIRYGDRAEGGRESEPLFEVRCKIEVKLHMAGIGSKDIVLELPVTVVHPAALPPPHVQNQEIPYAHTPPLPLSPYSHQSPYTTIPTPLPMSSPAPYYERVQSPYIPAPLPLVDQGQVWFSPPLPTAPVIGYQGYGTPIQVAHHYFSPPSANQQLQPLLNSPYVHPPPARPSSAEPIGSAPFAYSHQQHSHQQAVLVTPPVIPPSGLPLALPLAIHNTGIPLPPNTNNAGVNANATFSPQKFTGEDAANRSFGEVEVGKGDRAERISTHLRMSSRNRSVSPMAHRWGMGAGAGASSGAAVVNADPSAMSGGLASPGVESRPRTLSGVVHSPRPVLSPRQSFSNEEANETGKGEAVVLGKNSLPMSKQVGELERMAGKVLGRVGGGDLSGDFPRDEELGLGLGLGLGLEERAVKEKGARLDGVGKTLPGLPVPSGKRVFPPAGPARPRIDGYFGLGDVEEEEGDTPRTPTLTAVRKGQRARDSKVERSKGDSGAMGRKGITSTPSSEPFTVTAQESGRARGGARLTVPESGLDALERRLLAEVGTRKLEGDTGHPDVRAVLASSAEEIRSGAGPVDIPPSRGQMERKDSDSLNDSAISSLTLADGGRLGEETRDELGVEPEPEPEPEPDSDARTQRAGRGKKSSKSKSSFSGDERVGSSGGAPGRVLNPGVSLDREQDGSEKKKGKRREQRLRSGGEQQKAKLAQKAKGRVAEWLGRIDVDANRDGEVEEMGTGGLVLDDVDGNEPSISALLKAQNQKVSSGLPKVGEGEAKDKEKETKKHKDVVACEPNPRSSGFVPIGTLNRETFRRIPIGALGETSTPLTRTQLVEADVATANALSTIKPKKDLVAPPVVEDTRSISPSKQPAPSRSPNVVKSDVAITKLPSSRSSSKSPLPPSSGPSNFSTGTPLPSKATAFPPPSSPRLSSPTRDTPPKKLAEIPPLGAKKPVLAPALDSKYDVRSARGGRGGKVTAVASIWGGNAKLDRKEVNGAAGLNKMKTSVSAESPKPRLLKTTLPVAKSAPSISSSTSLPSPANSNVDPKSSSSPIKHSPSSKSPPLIREWVGRRGVPTPAVAALSSSLATPMLSSTASLARPVAPSAKTQAVVTRVVLPTPIPETISEEAEVGTKDVRVGARTSVDDKPASGQLAFGQARLRDLIKKYQGQIT